MRPSHGRGVRRHRIGADRLALALFDATTMNNRSL
jgi:hypothetical protein